MRRRDFLALCAAAVGCAAVGVKAEEQETTFLHTIHDCRWEVPNGYQLLVWDGAQWVDTPNGAAVIYSELPATMTFRAAQPRR